MKSGTVRGVAMALLIQGVGLDGIGITPAAGASAEPKEPSLGQATSVISIELLPVPKGRYTIGLVNGNNDSALAQASVEVQAFWMGRSEVSVAEYRACVLVGLCSDAEVEHQRGWRATCNWGMPNRENHPMNCIDWSQAKAFCEAAGGRLPTEAEWEVAARGADGRMYPWGDQFDASRMVTGKETPHGTRGVGSLQGGASPFGMLNMAGNVWEWVADAFVRSDRAAVPSEVTSARGTPRVMRGGGWFGDVSTAVLRHGAYPRYRSPDVGVRCAADAAKGQR